MTSRLIEAATLRPAILATIAVALSVAPAVGSIAPGFDSNTLASNDDGFVGPVAIGFDANFFGTTYNSLWVNNNGNVTFDGGLSTFTPFNLLSTNRVIIAPFFADVDTRNGTPVTYGQGMFSGRDAFGVNWVDVGHFSQQQDRLNSFQLLLVDRSDIAAGDFDILFNYDQILWEAGTASNGDQDGLGGFSARVGYSNGIDTAFELPGSAVNGAFIDGGPNSLAAAMQYVFQVRNGNVTNPGGPNGVVPEPFSMACWLGLLGAGASVVGRRR